MRTILILIQKEFLQVFRNRTMLPIIFILPVVQLLILVHAATFEQKNIKVFFVDKDLSYYSEKIIDRFKSSPFFIVAGSSQSIDEAENTLKTGTSDFIIQIPSDFEKKLCNENKAGIQVLINAVNAMTAGVISGYVNSIVMGLNSNILVDFKKTGNIPVYHSMDTSYLYWFNPELNYYIYMLPGILGILITIIGVFLTALNIVREKETGTIEQINVTPIKKYQFITGKLIPFLIIGLIMFTIGLFIGRLFFNIPVEGSYFLLYFFISLYLLAALGIGLFLSAVSETQQQVMLVAFFFLLVFIMMSGLFTPVESMPEWAQYLDTINPVAYLMKGIRMILLKGSGFMDLLHEIISLSVFAIIILSLAVWRYRKLA